jgi:predicted DNA-binding transcriptional regulator AlpA
MTNLPSPAERRIVRAKRSRELTGTGKSELYRKSSDPNDDFPAAVAIGDHAVGWYEDELIAWRDARPRVVCKLERTVA